MRRVSEKGKDQQVQNLMQHNVRQPISESSRLARAGTRARDAVTVAAGRAETSPGAASRKTSELSGEESRGV